ncbi:HCNGP-like protein [Corchorus olitorius]|uniref:HCNGP-like protein n=1 Tax=Corchorus olitorius TaxID=93759 RepID=A0A1R3H4Z9_9ROSI|nr:HCNGP-like protein [Corchorus olitorius]
MASRKKESEGIALLSMYNDEDDEDMEDMEEDDRPEHEQGGEEEDNEYRELNNNMEEEDSRANDNTPPRNGRGRPTIVDYGHDEAAMSPEPEEGELGSSDDPMFGRDNQVANGKTLPTAIEATPQSSDVEPSQLETKDNAVGESEGIEVEESVSVDNVDLLDKFLPPPPKAKCSEDLQKKIDKFLYLKRSGKSFNAEVRNRKEYRNPDFLLHAVKVQEIDQIGSCFSKDIFDPHGYDISDYYDEIEADMRRERERKEQESKKNQKVDFVSVGSQPGAVLTAPKVGMPISVVAASGLPSAPTAVDNIVRDGRQNKKSKWDKVLVCLCCTFTNKMFVIWTHYLIVFSNYQVDTDRRNPLPAGAQDSLSTVGAHTVLLSAANAGTGYTAFAQQKRRETEEKRSNERRLDRRS